MTQLIRQEQVRGDKNGVEDKYVPGVLARNDSVDYVGREALSRKLDVIVIGSGPIATLNALTIGPEYSVGWSIFRDKKDALLEHGVHLVHADNLTEDTENSASFLERTIEPADMTVDASSPVRGKLNLYVTAPGQILDRMPLADNGFIVIATKSYNNPNVLDQLEHILRKAKNPTIVLTQNGIAPEIRVSKYLKDHDLHDSAGVVRGVPLGPCTYADSRTLRNGIRATFFGHWNADSDHHAQLSQRVADLFHYMPAHSVGNQYRHTSAAKSLCNLINTPAVMFACTIGEAMSANYLNQLYCAKLNEGIEAFRSQDVVLATRDILDNSYHMFNTTREHMPSMGRDPFVIYQEGQNFPFPLDTETIDMDQQLVEWAANRGDVYWNSLCSDFVEDFCRSINDLRAKGLHDEAVEFGIRFVTRNRHIVGLEPYVLHKHARDFSIAGTAQQKVQERFHGVDTAIDQTVYLCRSAAKVGTPLQNLSDLLLSSYRTLKSEYLLDNQEFNLTQTSCTSAGACSGDGAVPMTPCYAKIKVTT